jgi:hypothetical protein
MTPLNGECSKFEFKIIIFYKMNLHNWIFNLQVNYLNLSTYLSWIKKILFSNIKK